MQEQRTRVLAISDLTLLKASNQHLWVSAGVLGNPFHDNIVCTVRRNKRADFQLNVKG